VSPPCAPPPSPSDLSLTIRRHLSFKSVEVEDGHSITCISHSPSGDRFIVCTASCQPKIFDRNGELVITFCRGDMYLRDLTNTKGHTMETTGCQWHPTDKQLLLTCSLDGSLRLWDLRGEALFGNLINKHVLKIRPKNGQLTVRIGATCCSYTRDGKTMVGGAADGTIHIWFTHSSYSRADIIIDSPSASVSPLSSRPSSRSSDGAGGGYVMSVVESPTQPGLLGARYENGLINVWKYSTKGKREVAGLQTFRGAKNVYQMANVDFR
jgi:WD40 repeat protein